MHNIFKKEFWKEESKFKKEMNNDYKRDNGPRLRKAHEGKLWLLISIKYRCNLKIVLRYKEKEAVKLIAQNKT